MAEDEEIPELEVGERVKERFEVEAKLGEGGFGAVFKVLDTLNHRNYAMKVENVNERYGVIKMEVTVLQALAKKKKMKHACTIIDCGKTDKVNFVIMTLVGRSLLDLKKSRPDYRFSLSTALRLGMNTLEAMSDLHSVGFIHRDCKPANFAIGRIEAKGLRLIYLLDFGLARLYLDENTGELRSARNQVGFRGTIRYAPLNAHEHRDLGRKDDIETWMYQLVDFTSGTLPWNRLFDKHDVHHSKTKTRKEGTLFKNCPPSYARILEYIDGLDFQDEPAYDWMKEGLLFELGKAGSSEKDPYDWEEAENSTGGPRRKTSNSSANKSPQDKNPKPPVQPPASWAKDRQLDRFPSLF